ncbi:MAG: hypothetical protein ACYDG3_09990 [Bacillati bacterium]
MKTAQQVADLADELYELELQQKRRESRIQDLRDRILEGMKLLNIDVIPRPDYTVSITHSPRYGKPTAEQLIDVLGKGAKKYIVETVDPKARLELPPQVAAKLFPMITDGETLRMRMRIDGNGKK